MDRSAACSLRSRAIMDPTKTLLDVPTSVTEPETGTRLSAVEIHDNILATAEKEFERPNHSLWWSALASGLVIGFSFLAGAYLMTLVPEAYQRAAAAAGYPLGFIFVVLARSELFTENTLEPIIPLLHRRDAKTLGQTLRLWGMLLLGNLVGALIFGFVLARTDVVSDADTQHALAKLAAESTSDGFGLTFYHAIFAGWLIALMAWLLASTRDTIAQIVLIWLTTAPIAAFGFRHAIAGSVEAFFRVAADTASLGNMLGSFIVPAVLGNIVGGVVLVALLNYGQVMADRTAESIPAPAGD